MQVGLHAEMGSGGSEGTGASPFTCIYHQRTELIFLSHI